MSADIAATIDRVLRAHRSACLDDPGDAERVRQALVEAIGADQGPRAPAREALTVGEAIQAIDDAPVIEYRDGRWRQIRGGRHGKVRYWWPARPASRFSPACLAQWGAWVDTDGVISADGDEPCRLVPLSEAGASPETRGPIGGAR